MKVIVIEDEKLAAEHIIRLIKSYDPDILIAQVLDSVKKSVKWFNSNPHPDLLFMDIQLADGLSFDIFKQCHIQVPIIFTTAYDEYAIKAFKVNGIDYLLKPISPEELGASIEKFKKYRISPLNQSIETRALEKVVQLLTKEYKNRFIIKIGEHIRIIPIEEICYFYSLEKATFIQTISAKSYPIEYSLDDLEQITDPTKFFRINRKYFICLKSIEDIISYSNSRLKIKLKNSKYDVIVSREKVNDFKAWLDK